MVYTGKTSFHCHLTSDFLRLNYSRISTGGWFLLRFSYFHLYSFFWVRYQFFKFLSYCCANLISTSLPSPPRKLANERSIIKKELKRFPRYRLWHFRRLFFSNGNIIFALFFARGDLMKSKIIFHFVLGLVGFFHLKASSIKFSRTTFPRTDSRRTETHTNVTLLLKYFQFRTSCLVESQHKTNFAWDAKCKLIKS